MSLSSFEKILIFSSILATSGSSLQPDSNSMSWRSVKNLLNFASPSTAWLRILLTCVMQISGHSTINFLLHRYLSKGSLKNLLRMLTLFSLNAYAKKNLSAMYYSPGIFLRVEHGKRSVYIFATPSSSKKAFGRSS